MSEVFDWQQQEVFPEYSVEQLAEQAGVDYEVLLLAQRITIEVQSVVQHGSVAPIDKVATVLYNEELIKTLTTDASIAQQVMYVAGIEDKVERLTDDEIKRLIAIGGLLKATKQANKRFRVSSDLH